MSRTLLRWPALLLVCAGCTAVPEGLPGSDSDADGPPYLVQALFEVPRIDAPPPSGFYALPFPNDLRVMDDGTIDLRDHLRPNQLIGLYLDTITAEQRGFGTTSGLFVRFNGPINPDSLPTPESSRQQEASVYLIDIDPDSPVRGERVPIATGFYERAGEAIGDNWLGVLPYPGFVLRSNTTYALVVTRRVTSIADVPIAPSGDFFAVVSDEPATDLDLARAQTIYQPLWQWLDEPGGDERSDIASAAVFTTGDPTDLMRRIRDVVWRDLPMPRPSNVTLRGERDGYAWYDAMYTGPRFQRGEPPHLREGDGGDIPIDPDTGEPILQAMEPLRVSFTVPVGEMPEAGWPLVLYAHGTGGDFHSFQRSGTARHLADAGIACMSIDQVMHGPRNESAPPDIAFFNFQNPLAARDNAVQGALDDFQLVRLAVNFDHIDRETGGRAIRFDPDRLYFFGHSQGSTTGVPFVAREPLIKGAVFSGAGGLLYLAMLHKTQPIDIAGIIKVFLRDDPLDQFNPILAMLQMYMERADAVAYGHLLVDRPPEGHVGKHVFVSEGLIDRYTPIPSIEALATSIGTDPVMPLSSEVYGLTLAGHPTLEAPVAGNRDGTTAVLLQYEEVAGSDGHFVLFDRADARMQSIEFIRSMVEEGTATLYPR